MDDAMIETLLEMKRLYATLKTWSGTDAQADRIYSSGFVLDGIGAPRVETERPAEDPADFPTDYTHNRARDVIKDVLSGSITKGGRREIRKALDTKEAPPTREQARDQALGRALRFGR